MLAIVRNVLPSNVNCIYTRQPAPLGLGHAVLCAAPIVGDEPFVVLLADDLIDANTSATQQLIDAAHKHEGSVMAIQNVRPEDTNRYGRSEEHTSELQSLMRHSYAVFCLKKKTTTRRNKEHTGEHQPTHDRTRTRSKYEH